MRIVTVSLFAGPAKPSGVLAVGNTTGVPQATDLNARTIFVWVWLRLLKKSFEGLGQS